MAAQPARKVATYEDVLAAPENMVAEVIDGELYLQPRPAARHARAGAGFGGYLWFLFEGGSGPGGWVIVDELELHLGVRPDIVVPDVGGWRAERYPHSEDAADAPYFTVAPDWLAEILSPGTARKDRMKKVPLYAREGVRHVWLIDPRVKTVEVLRLEGEGYRLAGTWGGDEDARIEPFDAVALPLGRMWGRGPGASGP
jgi:Uma2 family endonuclease